eukprot:CAMPEP_0179212640 /NCGR_PEP_ID=MMETSP0797-20121207/1216_1 /TAXON_ID=47934 /ORGANISM="Dinophysis acuminata, Strain DAEP01" /LENGTH=99 /DNA_ID=CAMNT_0020918271 /DNA_START=35 /DNA_END=330 /DNA_ORIENTATION=+
MCCSPGMHGPHASMACGCRTPERSSCDGSGEAGSEIATSTQECAGDANDCPASGQGGCMAGVNMFSRRLKPLGRASDSEFDPLGCKSCGCEKHCMATLT